MSAVITAGGYADETGFGGSSTRFIWKQTGQQAVRWRSVSDVRFERYGRLDVMSKHALIAADMLGLAASPPRSLNDWAICAATACGSVDVDTEFCRSIGQPGGASPALFTYTLPSCAMAEIAIRYRITGPNVCLLCGDDSAFAVLREGLGLIESGDAAACVCVVADGVTPAAAECTGCPAGKLGAAFLLESEAAARDNGHPPMAALDACQGSPAAHAAFGPGSRQVAKGLYEFLHQPEGSGPCILRPTDSAAHALIARRLVDHPPEEQA